MKPALFDYHRPGSLEESVALLSELGEDAKVIAGGQSLVPMMNLRLAQPSALIDIASLTSLAGVAVVDGELRVGGLTRHVDLERNAVPGPLGGLLRQIARHIGHLPVRTRGTIGGSLAHADPSAEWCLLVRTLDGRIVAEGPHGTRVIDGAEFFRGYLETALAPDEILTEVRLPQLIAHDHAGFVEFARRAGDFAIVSAASVLTIDDGVIVAARVGLAGVADRPVRSPDAEAVLTGQHPDEHLFADAAQHAAAAVQPPADLQATSDDRRDLVRALVFRALQQAHDRSASADRNST